MYAFPVIGENLGGERRLHDERSEDHYQAGGGAEGTQGIRDLYQTEEERLGVCLSQHRWHLYHLGPKVSNQ